MKKYIGTIIWLALAVLTLLPIGVRGPGLLPYDSHCTFAPISTVICLFFAWFSLWWQKRRKAPAASGDASS